MNFEVKNSETQTENQAQQPLNSPSPSRVAFDYPQTAYKEYTSSVSDLLKRYLPILMFDLAALSLVLILTYEFNRSRLFAGLVYEPDFLTENIGRVIFYGSVVILTLVSFYWNGLYRHGVICTRVKQLALIARSTLVTGAIVILFSFLFLNYTISETFKDFLISYVVVGTVIVFMVRMIFRGFIKNNNRISTLKPAKSIIIIGAGQAGRLYAASKTSNIEDVGIVFLDDDENKIGQKILGYYVEGKPEDVVFKSITAKADEICIIIKNISQQRLLEIIQHCKKTGVPTKVLSSHYNLMFTGLYSKANEQLKTIPLENSTSRIDLAIKRLTDLTVGLLSLLILFIPCLIIALGVKLSSRGPVFYRSVRIGKRGKRFIMYKFRSMEVNVEIKHQETALERLRNGLHMGKVDKDPRITKFGKFLRKYCLDELPQVFNILKGDMSLIGPRPCFDYEMEMFEEWHNRRFLMKPGITGLWQVTGRQMPDLLLNDAMTTDVFYTDNYSIWMDFRILFKTIPVVLYGKGR